MVKVISLSEEAYGKLKSIKGDKSFSEVIVEVVDKNKKGTGKDLMKFFGIWKDDSDYWKEFNKEIRKSRNSARLREVKL